LLAKIHAMAAPHGDAAVRLDSHWLSDVRWGRNRITKAGDWRDVSVGMNHCDCIGMQSNQTDLGSLRGMLDWAETMTKRFHGRLPDAVPAVMPRDGRPFPESVVAAGRQCLRKVHLANLSPYDWPLALRLAIGTNEDTLVRAIVARQLALASKDTGQTVRTRAEVLDTAVRMLWTNAWNNDETSHRTPAHDTLAQVFAAQLDTMTPGGPVLTTRLRLFDLFNANRMFSEDDTAGDIDAERAVYLQRIRIAKSVPLNTVSADELWKVQPFLEGEPAMLAKLAYYQKPTHDNFMAYLAARRRGASRTRAINLKRSRS
jgi:hypothetical protein